MRRAALTAIVLAMLAAVASPAAARLVSASARAGSPAWPVQTTAPPIDVLYQPPIDAPIVDPFRPPATPYGPGNRGVEYATRAGTPVRAAADGVVTFAGQVGGQLYVTVAHADGVRTSYSYLASIAVRFGAHVQGGAVLGTTGVRFHVGARRGDEYFDPMTLWSHRGRAVLVPLDG